MLVWSPKMYLDAKLMKKKRKIQRLLEKKPLKNRVYCITLPVNQENMMEIYPSWEFWFRQVVNNRLVVIGLAETKEKAAKLAAQICLDVLQIQGDISPELVRKFFMPE